MAGVQTGKPRTSARKAPASAGATSRTATATKSGKAAPRSKPQRAFDAERWQQMVATAAYLRAEARGFVGGSAEEDWLEAEKEITARLAAT